MSPLCVFVKTWAELWPVYVCEDMVGILALVCVCEDMVGILAPWKPPTGNQPRETRAPLLNPDAVVSVVTTS